MTQVNILQMYISSLQSKVNCTNQIEKKQHTLRVKQDLPTTLKETTERLNAAQKQVQHLWKKYQSKRTTLLEDKEEACIASCPNICPLRAARIFINFKDSSEMY